VIDPATATDHITDLFIHGDKIIAHGEKPSGFSIDETIDARNTVVCPGLVDISARLGEPGTEQKGTIASEARAAALGEGEAWRCYCLQVVFLSVFIF
jgi:dihydroorotase